MMTTEQMVCSAQALMEQTGLRTFARPGKTRFEEGKVLRAVQQLETGHQIEIPGRRILFCRSTIPWNYALRLMLPHKFTHYSFSYLPLMGVVEPPAKGKIPTEEEILAAVCDLMVKDFVQEIQRMEREELRAKRRGKPKYGSWSPVKRKAPLSDGVNDQVKGILDREWLELSEHIVHELGPPWEVNFEDKRVKYDPIKVAACILALEKLGPRYRDLARVVRQEKYDLRTPKAYERGEKAKYGSASYFHKVLAQKIPPEYLLRALHLLDQYAQEQHQQVFGSTNLEEYAVDGTNPRAIVTEVRMRDDQPYQTWERVPYQALIRLAINTVVFAEPIPEGGAGRVDQVVNHVPSGSSMYADKAYDVEANHRQTAQMEIDFQCPPKMVKGRPYSGEFRSQNQANYDPRRYRRRKLGERPFGNLEVRGGGVFFETLSCMREKRLVIRLIAHNFQTFAAQVMWSYVFNCLSLPSQKLSEENSIEAQLPTLVNF